MIKVLFFSRFNQAAQQERNNQNINHGDEINLITGHDDDTNHLMRLIVFAASCCAPASGEAS
jgi:hypothetical protein